MSPRAVSSEGDPLPRRVVLAVLDDTDRSTALKASLVSRGWEVIAAGSCEEARAFALERHVDALLTELVLPDGSAFRLLRSLASRPAVAGVLTWGNQHGIRERIARSGFDLHLVRPITADEVDQTLRSKLAQKLRDSA